MGRSDLLCILRHIHIMGYKITSDCDFSDVQLRLHLTSWGMVVLLTLLRKLLLWKKVHHGLVVKTTASQGHEMYCSWSGGHGFEPRLSRTLGLWYFCLKSYLNPPKINLKIWHGIYWAYALAQNNLLYIDIEQDIVLVRPATSNRLTLMCSSFWVVIICCWLSGWCSETWAIYLITISWLPAFIS